MKSWLNGLFLSIGLALVLCGQPAEAQLFGGYPSYLRPIRCTTACNIASIAVGQTAIIEKTSDTLRASTTTLTADNDLAFTNLPAGEFSVQIQLVWVATVSTGGWAYNWNDTAATTTDQIGGNTYCDATTTTIRKVWTTTATAYVNCTPASVGTDMAYLAGASAGGGTLSIFWAQNASNASSTILKAGSYFIVTRLH